MDFRNFQKPQLVHAKKADDADPKLLDSDQPHLRRALPRSLLVPTMTGITMYDAGHGRHLHT